MYQATKTFVVPGHPQFVEGEEYATIPDERLVERGLFKKIKKKSEKSEQSNLKKEDANVESSVSEKPNK